MKNRRDRIPVFGKVGICDLWESTLSGKLIEFDIGGVNSGRVLVRIDSINNRNNTKKCNFYGFSKEGKKNKPIFGYFEFKKTAGWIIFI